MKSILKFCIFGSPKNYGSFATFDVNTVLPEFVFIVGLPACLFCHLEQYGCLVTTGWVLVRIDFVLG